MYLQHRLSAYSHAVDKDLCAVASPFVHLLHVTVISETIAWPYLLLLL